MTTTDKKYMNWNKFDSDINAFIEFIQAHNFIENAVILALKRGGFASAIALSNKTGIPISTVAYQTRDGSDSEPRFLEPELIKPNSMIIIPDDIYDTGVTIENTVTVLQQRFDIPLNNIMGLFHFGSEALQNTKLTLLKVMDSNENRWCVFPWE